MEGPFVLGVDGGSTKTIALVAGPDGRVQASARAGGSDIYDGLSQARVELRRAVDDALRGAGVRPTDLAAAVFSLSGADWPEDYQLLNREIAGWGLGGEVQVANDAFGALRAGIPDGVGVSLVCGTGVAIGARSKEGRWWHASHWMGALDGGLIGDAALSAVYRSELGIEPPTTLTGRVLDCLGAASVEEVLCRRTARTRPVPDVPRSAALIPLVLDEAAAGHDVAAQRIVKTAGEDLGRFVLAAARQVGLGDDFVVALAGGAFHHPSDLLAATIRETLQAWSPKVSVRRSQLEPAAGAVLMALDLAAGGTVGEAQTTRLLETMPPPDLFSTDAA